MPRDGNGWARKDWGEGFPKGMRKLLGEMDIFITLIVVMVSQMHTCVKTYQVVYFKHMQFQFSSVAQSCPTHCDPMNHSTPGLPVHHQLPEFTQTHVH